MLECFSTEYHETRTNKSGQSGEPIKILLIADVKHEIRWVTFAGFPNWNNAAGGNSEVAGALSSVGTIMVALLVSLLERSPPSAQGNAPFRKFWELLGYLEVYSNAFFALITDFGEGHCVYLLTRVSVAKRFTMSCFQSFTKWYYIMLLHTWSIASKSAVLFCCTSICCYSQFRLSEILSTLFVEGFYC